MNIYAIYFIASDGRLMFDEIFQNSEKLPSVFILSGLLSTFKNISSELTGDYPESLIMGDISYHFESFEDYFIVLVSDEKENPSDLLFSLGMKFSSKYGHIAHDWNGDMTVFFSFKATLIQEIAKVSNFDLTGSIDPNRPLNADELVLLDSDLKPVALTLIVLKEATLDKIWSELNTTANRYSSAEIITFLVKLQELGYVGRKETEDAMIYFI